MIAPRGMIRDDFAGPGGWSVALAMLGLSDVGVELNPDAARVARAAGFRRWIADVTSDEVRDFLWNLWLYIASPPCQTFSMAGKGSGRQHMSALLRAMHLVADGWTPEEAVTVVGDEALDVRSVLVLEPLLVIREQAPALIAFEQVKEVQPIWDAYAEILRSWGYSVWTGLLHAEQYGVPQTRTRAILTASRVGPVTKPPATHSRYYSRTPEKLDEGVLPWISMAQALTWGMGDLVGFPRLSDGQAEVTIGGVAYRDRYLRPAAAPAQTVTEKARSWQRFMRANAQARSAVRSVDHPAPTIKGRHDTGDRVWLDFGQMEVAGPGSNERVGTRPRPVSEPSATITGARSSYWRPSFNDQSGTPFDPDWPSKRPATVVAGREIVQNPGATANRFNGSTKSRNDGVRVTVQEAGILQSFPADYPWEAAGSKTSQYQRVGDAMPPLLALAVLKHLTSE